MKNKKTLLSIISIIITITLIFTFVTIKQTQNEKNQPTTQTQYYQIDNGDKIKIKFSPKNKFLQLTQSIPFSIIDKENDTRSPYLSGNFISGMDYYTNVQAIEEKLKTDSEFISLSPNEQEQGMYVTNIYEKSSNETCDYIIYGIQEIKANDEYETNSNVRVEYTTILGLIKESNTAFVITGHEDYNTTKEIFNNMVITCEDVIELDDSFIQEHTHTETNTDENNKTITK